MASLKGSGSVPVDRDRFTMLVIAGARMSTHCLTREVGIGLSWHCLSGDSMMSFLISSHVAGSKVESVFGVDGGGGL